MPYRKKKAIKFRNIKFDPLVAGSQKVGFGIPSGIYKGMVGLVAEMVQLLKRMSMGEPRANRMTICHRQLLSRR